MKLFTKVRLMLLAMLLGTSFGVKAVGWPANYEGVMLQGFYWDSYSETSWANLTAQADELSKYFKLIWVPNSAKAEGSPSMGYHPIYWFTNHNSSFGTEAQLRNMISTFKAKGTGFIADVVINHRSGVSNWTNFPTETWNGKTYSIGLDGICRDDEVRNQSGQGTPTGNYDTGEGWDGSRDLDHTNANVQANIKDYIKCLLTDFGYSGVRYDFVKGYGSQYTKMYNQANNVQFSVGEYWDGSYDAVKAWIDGTGKESAAFDFPFKYQLNKAFNGGSNYGELVWKAYGTTDQPAGMIHADYQQYAVTFIDNHDTYRDGSKYTGDVLVANAFMLSSPGTPCVFYPHYKQYKSQIQAMIAARNGAGVTNTSKVNVLESGSCYVAEVQGTKGKLWVKLGNSSKTPGSGYTKKASGNGYEIWTTTAGGTGDVGGGDTGGNTGGSVPASLYVIGEVNSQTWDPSVGTAMTKTGNKFYKDVTVDGYFSFAVSLAADWDALNVYGNRYAPSADTELTLNGSSALTVAPDDAKAWYCTPGDYALIVDFDAMTVTLAPKGTVPQGGNTGGGNDNPGGGNTGGGSAPGSFYVIGEVNSQSWDPSVGTVMTKTGNKFYKDVTVDGYFSFAVSLAADWDALNVSGNRYAPSVDTELTLNGSSALTVAPDDAKAWYCTPGEYALIVDFDAMTVTLSPKGTVPQGGNTGGGNDNPGGGTGGGSVEMPAALYLVGNFPGCQWDPNLPIAMEKGTSGFLARNVDLVEGYNGNGYWSFLTVKAALPADYNNTENPFDWDGPQGGNSGDRYGSAAPDTPLSLGGSSPMVRYEAGVNASAAQSWMTPIGKYDIVADFKTMTVKLVAAGTGSLPNEGSAVEAIESDFDGEPEYYNLQGVRVYEPSQGIYIVRRGNKVTKEVVR